MADIIDLYVGTQDQIKTAVGLEDFTEFTSVEDLLSSYSQKDFTVIEGGKNIYKPDNVVQFVKKNNIQEATGGVKTSPNMANLTEIEGGGVKATSNGVAGSVPLDSVISNGLLSLGFTVLVADGLEDMFYSSLVQKLYGKVLETKEDIANYQVQCWLRDNPITGTVDTYIPAEVVQYLADTMEELGYLDPEASPTTYDEPTVVTSVAGDPRQMCINLANIVVSRYLSNGWTFDEPAIGHEDSTSKHFSFSAEGLLGALQFTPLENAIYQIIASADNDNVSLEIILQGTTDGLGNANVLAPSTSGGYQHNRAEFENEVSIIAGFPRIIQAEYRLIRNAITSIDSWDYIRVVTPSSGQPTEGWCETGYNVEVSTRNVYASTSNLNIIHDEPINENIKKQGGDPTIPIAGLPLEGLFNTWFEKLQTLTGLDPNTLALKDLGYLPFNLNGVNPLAEPVAGTQPVAQDGVVPSPFTPPVLDAPRNIGNWIENPTPPINPEVPTDSGNTPIIVPPTTGLSASAMYTIYNPTQSEIDSLGSYLWSESIVSILQSFLQNPMDAIIGLSVLYANPSIGNSKNIKLGYLDSGVSAHVVTNQYIDIDCGTVNVYEYFGNAMDYNPYTKVSMYLPFIGIVQLDSNEIVGGTITVKYTVDVLTGTCLATIRVNRDRSDAILYTFSGNCAVELPLTGGNRTGVISSLLSIAAGGLVAGATGAVVAGLHDVSKQKYSVSQSGNIGSNAGAMGYKKPYLIITRSTPYMAENYKDFYGIPSNDTVTLGNCSGYTRVREVHVDSIANATQTEKEMLDSVLRNGIIIS